MRRRSPFRGLLLLGPALGVLLLLPPLPAAPIGPALAAPLAVHAPRATSVEGNFSAALSRLVDLVAAAGGSLLALVWARVALSWFSHDVTKKIQARERARDALIGTLVFTAAVTGLVWGLAQWVVTGA
ncbi:MAG TPA: hypothetical protein VGU43_06530 [Thermoplasmata archaeon]|nr:hypothetical protein [Thermoplasmata archaeon]